jgi:hypothetical protein
MKISIQIKSDSYNTQARDEIEFVGKKEVDIILIKLGDRDVKVDKYELLEAISLLSKL